MFLYESLEDECGDVTIDIKFDAGLVASRDALNSKNDANLALVSYIVFNAMLPPTEQTMQNLLGDGEALTRTILFLGLPLADGVVFGDDMRLHAEDWARYLEVSESFLMLRSTAWDRERVSKAPAAPVSDRSEEFQGLSGQDGLKHTHMVVGDVINVALWDRAKWGVTLAQVDRDGTVVVGLLFGDVEVGKKIFRGLRRRFGPVDTHDSLQLVFLTGIDATAPLHYRVLLAENWELLIASPKRTAGFMLTRTNTMSAQNTLVLDLMNKLRDQKGDFLLAPCALDAGGRPKVLLDYAIQKLSLSVVPAWTVGESSPWLMVLRPEDNVWVPEDVTDPPVTKAPGAAQILQKMSSARGALKALPDQAGFPARNRKLPPGPGCPSAS